MARDKPPPSATDNRVAAIVVRLDRAVMDGREDEDREVAALLVSISKDRRRAALHGELIEAIEGRYGTGQNGSSLEILERLRRYCEASADEFALEAQRLEEVKASTWNPAMMALLGSSAATGAGAILAASGPAGLLAAALFGGALVARSGRIRTHGAKEEAERATNGLRALIGLLDRRSR